MLLRFRNVLVVVAYIALLVVVLAPVVATVASAVEARREAGETAEALAQFGETTTVCEGGYVWVLLSPFGSTDSAAMAKALEFRPYNEVGGTIRIGVSEEQTWCFLV